MKRTYTLAILTILFSMVALNVSYARMTERPPERLEPVPDWHCACETPYCDCVYDCGTPYTMCLVAYALTGQYDIDLWDLGDMLLHQEMPVPWACEQILNQCKADCERTHGEHVEFTCYGMEDNALPIEEQYLIDSNAR